MKLRKFTYSILYALTVFLLLLQGTTREWVHDLLANHKDTTSCNHQSFSKGEAYFENEHHHCDSLNYVLSLYDHFNGFNYILQVTTYVLSYNEVHYQPVHCYPIQKVNKGPPSIYFQSLEVFI